MRALFIADAHLRHPQDNNYQSLLNFLDLQQGNLDALFLLGDIFEFWVGYRHVVFSEHLPLLTRLQNLAAAGCRLYYVEGNHDFNLGDFFHKTLECTVVPDQQLVEWDGQKIFICHGDLANPGATGYLLMRSFWRSRFLKFIAKIIPPDSAWRFGNFLCDLSRKKKRRRHDPSPLVLPYAEQAVTLEADRFICGHFHYPLQSRRGKTEVTVLGDWISQFSYLELIDGKGELKSFAAASSSVTSTARVH